jgi:hypothetical protein
LQNHFIAPCHCDYYELLAVGGENQATSPKDSRSCIYHLLLLSILPLLYLIPVIMSSPCCPPNSEKFLAADYTPVGFTGSLPDGTEFYASGTPEGRNGILVIPDVYGINGGRTRSIIDQFAEAGYFAIAPKLLVPALEGGTDGEGDCRYNEKTKLQYLRLFLTFYRNPSRL